MLEVKTARKKNYKCTSRDNKKEREKVKSKNNTMMVERIIFVCHTFYNGYLNNRLRKSLEYKTVIAVIIITVLVYPIK